MKNKQKIVGSIVILLLIICFLVVGIMINKPKTHKVNEDDIFVEDSVNVTSQKIDDKKVTVYIQGEVKKPGVYSLKSGSIIEDLVKASGGYTENANTSSNVNLAKKLKDEDYVFIEKKPDVTGINSSTKNIQEVVKNNDKININTASLEELDKVPGIGPTTAQKIIDYRTKNGQFSSIEDLKKLGGIGDKTISKFRDKVDIR